LVEIIEKEREQKVSEGLDFVLNQVGVQSLFPRNIATKNTNNGQITIYSKAEAMQFYKNSEFIDCRISAYPYRYYNNNSNGSQLITFSLIDLDLKTFDWSKTKLDKYLFGKLLPNMKKQHDIEPSVVWSGNGYHIYIKIEPTTLALEQMDEFVKFKEPSKEMLKFLERYFSGGKCDNAHNCSVSFTNCMLRVPGSVNSKSVTKKIDIHRMSLLHFLIIRYGSIVIGIAHQYFCCIVFAFNCRLLLYIQYQGSKVIQK
jgi:hypothetical protein